MLNEGEKPQPTQARERSEVAGLPQIAIVRKSEGTYFVCTLSGRQFVGAERRLVRWRVAEAFEYRASRRFQWDQIDWVRQTRYLE